MPADPNCIFCKIAAGQVPCHKLYEDGRLLAMLDVGPLSRGHCLILPREHYQTIDQLPDDLAAACFALVPRLSRAVTRAVGAAGWNVLQNNGQIAGQSVGHVHVHIIPRTAGDALGYRWPAGKLDPGDARGLVESIRAGM